MSAKMTAMVAVRKSNPTRTAVRLIDAVVSSLCDIAGSATADMSDFSVADMESAICAVEGTCHRVVPAGSSMNANKATSVHTPLVEHHGEAVDHVAESGDDEEDAQEPWYVT